MAEATVIVPDDAVSDLRHIVREDREGFAESMGDHEGDELAAHRRMMGHPERLLVALGPDTPGDREIRVDPEYLRSLFGSVADQATAVLSSGRGDPDERRDELRRLRCAVQVFEALEASA